MFWQVEEDGYLGVEVFFVEVLWYLVDGVGVFGVEHRVLGDGVEEGDLVF